MTSLQTSKLVGHPWSDLFNLVLDVTNYPEFVPHCREVRILSRTAQDPEMTIIISRMTVGFSVFDVGYANRTTGGAIARRIDVEISRRAAALSARSVALRAARRGSDRAALFGGLRIQQSSAGWRRLARFCCNVRQDFECLRAARGPPLWQRESRGRRTARFRRSAPAHHQLIKPTEEQPLMSAACTRTGQPAGDFFPPTNRAQRARASRAGSETGSAADATSAVAHSQQ